jgi:hypothetical protein
MPYVELIIAWNATGNVTKCYVIKGIKDIEGKIHHS